MKPEFTMVAAAVLLAAAPTAIAHETPSVPADVLGGHDEPVPGIPPEDLSDVYQDDGGSGEDAADSCDAAVEKELELQPNGETRGGELMPGLAEVEEATTLGDLHDVWQLPIESPVPDDMRVFVETRTPLALGGQTGFQVTVTVLDPQCHVIAEGEMSADGDLVVTPPLGDPGTYRVGLTIENPRVHEDLSASPGGPIPLAGHCAPMCFQYHLYAFA